jgi:hypothetical protein
MQLNSSDGVSVDLRIAGYECPGVIDSEWGANWLQVCGHITLADGRAWAFEHPSLTTWEARELGDWLREVAAGTVPPSPPGSGKFEGLMCFTEPNLSFNLADRSADRVRIGVDFTQEATPPWLKRRRGRYSSNYTVRLDVSVDEVTQAAESWIHDLAGFPERYQPPGSLAVPSKTPLHDEREKDRLTWRSRPPVTPRLRLGSWWACVWLFR